MKKHFLKATLLLMGLMGTLAIWAVNAQEINKDIVLQATSTEANQTLKINKYFKNAYTVDWGDGTPVTGLTADTTHTYSVASGYIITLSTTADRWTFQSVSKPLVPTNGTSMTWVKIIQMPSLADWFGVSATAPWDYFFAHFNNWWQLTSLPEGSFDTSNITTAWDDFFRSFNNGWALTSLPTGSFDTSNITTAWDDFFWYFNSRWQLTILPKDSFNINNINIVGDFFFGNFNYNWVLTSLPEKSFRLSTWLTTVGDEFFVGFNSEWQLMSLPDGSFDTSNITKVWYRFFSYFNGMYDNVVGWALTSLPENSFRLSTWLTTVWNAFFECFNVMWQLTSLPENSFDTSYITTVGSSFFSHFNAAWQLTSLPKNSFRLSTWLTTVGSFFFDDFNWYNWQLTSLPEWSFDTSKITTVGDFFFYSFNWNWQLTSLPEWSFDTSNITTVGYSFFSSFNNWWALKTLPEDSFRLSTWLTTAGGSFFSSFNYSWALTTLPEKSFDTSNITTVGDDFFSSFNANWQLTSLSEWSFRLSTWLTTVGDFFFYSFNWNWQLTSLPEWSFRLSTWLTTVGIYFFSYFNYKWQLTSLPEWAFDTSNITTVGNYFFSNFNRNWQLTSLPETFKLNSVAYNKARSYQNAFNSTWYTINKKVSGIVSWVTVPSSDMDVFSDNQPWRCGVHENWLVSKADACHIIYDANEWEWTTIWWYESDATIIEVWSGITLPIRVWYSFSGWKDASWNKVEEIVFPDMDGQTLYANREINQYTITLDIDWTLTAITWDYGSPVNKPANPKKDWYRFIGWEPEIPDTMPAADMTVKAKWERNWSSGWWGWGWGWWWSSSSSSTGSNTTPGSDTSNNTWNQQTWSGANSSTGTQNEQPTSWTKINEPEANTGSNIQTWNQVDSPDNSSEWQTYTQEFQQAYEFAKWHWITTMPTINDANMDGKLTRIAMAKMLSQYAINVLWKTPDATQNNKFNDVTDKLDSDYDNGVTLAYQLWIMWQNMPNNKFRPDDEVTRAEFATALSRMIYWTSDWVYKSTDKYYTNHMEKLVEEWIITKDDPKMKELRGYVMIMLMRSRK